MLLQLSQLACCTLMVWHENVNLMHVYQACRVSAGTVSVIRHGKCAQAITLSVFKVNLSHLQPYKHGPHKIDVCCCAFHTPCWSCSQFASLALSTCLIMCMVQSKTFVRRTSSQFGVMHSDHHYCFVYNGKQSMAHTVFYKMGGNT